MVRRSWWEDDGDGKQMMVDDGKMMTEEGVWRRTEGGRVKRWGEQSNGKEKGRASSSQMPRHRQSASMRQYLDSVHVIQQINQ